MTAAKAIVTRLLESYDLDFDPKDYAIDTGTEAQAKLQADIDAGNITADTIRALNVSPGDYVYSRHKFDSRGHPAGAKITSVQLWSTRPKDFKIKWKYGMYEYGDITPFDARQFTFKPGPSREEIAANKEAKLNVKRQDVYNRDEPTLGESKK